MSTADRRGMLDRDDPNLSVRGAMRDAGAVALGGLSAAGGERR